MSGLETAIRNALERSDRADPEIRARIYQSARQALEGGLRKQDISDTDIISGQRQRLEAMIRQIEGEERMRQQAAAISAAVESPAPVANQPYPAAPQPRPVPPPAAGTPLRVPVQPHFSPPPPVNVPLQPRPDVVDEEPAAAEVASPQLRGETRQEPSFGAAMDDDASLDDMRPVSADHLGRDAPEPALDAMPERARKMDFKPDRAAVRRKPRKIFSRLLVFCIVVAALGAGAWWVKTSGVLMTAAQRDTSVPNPPAHVDAEDYNGDDDDSGPSDGSNQGIATIDPQDSFSSQWTEILKPSDVQKVSAGGQAKAEAVSENEGPAIRITSASSSPDGSASIEVPASILQEMAGKPSTIALTLQSVSNTPMQITVECDFKSLGTCGRHRFDVSRQKSDALFQVKLSGNAPAGSGRLLINSDLDGKGSGVNVYAVRVLPGQ